MEPVYNELNDRDKEILRYIVKQFIETANPVASRNVSKNYDIGLSPATIRNIMADLEDSGYLEHPHTSAGRVPTDKGYRFYVDNISYPVEIDIAEKAMIERGLEVKTDETDLILKIASSLLSDITNQLACVSFPRLEKGILEKIQVVQLSNSRVLTVITIKDGLIKTITLEFNQEIKEEGLAEVQSLLNERLSGLSLLEIRNTFNERFKDVEEELKPMVRVFIESADKIFTGEAKPNQFVVTGAKNIMKQPEFEKGKRIQDVVELMESNEVIIQFFEGAPEDKEGVYVKIGSENNSEKFKEYSLISKNYNIGNMNGVLGIIGPKRMQYERVISAVSYISEVLSDFLRNGNMRP